jgi:hypothetical protein
VRITLVLLSCLFLSGPSERSGRYSFPSHLREDCIAVLTKMILTLGPSHATAVLTGAIQHDNCPVNGTLAEEARRDEWVRRTVTYASAGDWKKFKSSIKMLCRG